MRPNSSLKRAYDSASLRGQPSSNVRARATHRASTSVTKIGTAPRCAAIAAALLVVVLLFAPSAKGQSPDDMAADLLHADLPLFGRGGDKEWPQHFYTDDSFGCTSRVAFGDWAFRKRDTDIEGDVQWYRFSNYGVFHCWANVFRADERSNLNGADAHPSFFVLLGTTTVKGKAVELWTIQIGARPGSEYLLLSRAPGEGRVEAFEVLQRACPRANVRDAGSLDIVLTRYCVVNSREDLTRLARRMAQLPPLGTLTLAPADGESEDNADEGLR